MPKRRFRHSVATRCMARRSAWRQRLCRGAESALRPEPAGGQPRSRSMTEKRLLFRQFLHTAAVAIEGDIDRIERLLSMGEGHDRKVRLLAYAGYRNACEARISGRVVRYEKPL